MTEILGQFATDTFTLLGILPRWGAVVFVLCGISYGIKHIFGWFGRDDEGIGN